MIKSPTQKIKAKDYCSISNEYFTGLPMEAQTELVSHHFRYKRRRLNREVLLAFIGSITPVRIHQVVCRLGDNKESIKKFFRAIKNIDSSVLNDYLLKYTKKNLFEAVTFLKLEDRRKIKSALLIRLPVDQLALLINEHFHSFGKLTGDLFTDKVPFLEPDKLTQLLSCIQPKHLSDFLKATQLDSMKLFAKSFKLGNCDKLVKKIKGRITIIVVPPNKDYLIKNGKRNKRNVLFINRVLFANPDMLFAKLELHLIMIHLKQRKHISNIITPLFHNLKLLHAIVNLPVRRINSVIRFLRDSGFDKQRFVYQFICEHDIKTLKKIKARQYHKIMQALFDSFYIDFQDKYLPQKGNDPVIKKKIQKLVACRFIESVLEDVGEHEIPFLFQFESYLDEDGRTLLGYYRQEGVNLEIRPTIKQFARSFVRFRPRINKLYEVFRISAKNKILDYVPVTYQIGNGRFQHISQGYFVARYLKGLQPKPRSFRTYLTADSKLYLGKIENEVIQTLISFLEGATPLECIVKKNEDSFLLNIYLFNSQSGRFEYRNPIRSIELHTERPYFTHLKYDFSPEAFLELDKRSFNNALRYFKPYYFASFYNSLTIEQKKDIFEKLTTKGENALIDKIGEEQFHNDLDTLTFTFGEELDILDSIIADKMGIAEPAGYVEVAGGRRKTDFLVPEISDLDDDSYFAMRESARIEEFGFDFVSYPPELTFRIKMEILAKIYESFPNDLRRYIKTHASDIDDEIQNKILLIDPRLLDGIVLEKSYAIRKDPIKRTFINNMIKLFEDTVAYDTINEIIIYLRDPKIRIRQDDDTGRFIIRSEVIENIKEMAQWDYDALVAGMGLIISDV